MKTSEELIKIVNDRKEFVTLEDGFVYFCPTEGQVVHEDGRVTSGGDCFSSEQLRVIADELDRRNAEWQLIINNDPALQG